MLPDQPQQCTGDALLWPRAARASFTAAMRIGLAFVLLGTRAHDHGTFCFRALTTTATFIPFAALTSASAATGVAIPARVVIAEEDFTRVAESSGDLPATTTQAS